jgi:hypothetical protein
MPNNIALSVLDQFSKSCSARQKTVAFNICEEIEKNTDLKQFLDNQIKYSSTVISRKISPSQMRLNVDRVLQSASSSLPFFWKIQFSNGRVMTHDDIDLPSNQDGAQPYGEIHFPTFGQLENAYKAFIKQNEILGIPVDGMEAVPSEEQGWRRFKLADLKEDV